MLFFSDENIEYIKSLVDRVNGCIEKVAEEANTILNRKTVHYVNLTCHGGPFISSEDADARVVHSTQVIAPRKRT